MFEDLQKRLVFVLICSENRLAQTRQTWTDQNKSNFPDNKECRSEEIGNTRGDFVVVTHKLGVPT